MTLALNKRVSRAATGELPPLRGIIYARASVDRKGRSISVASQVAEGRRFFKKHNIVVVAVLVDNAISASRYGRHERQEYTEALRLLATGEANLLWTWEASRAMRQLEAFVELRNLLIKVRGYWAYDDRIYDMDDPDDRIDTAEDAVDSEKESEKLRKRVRRGVKSRAFDGEHHGPIWFGHMKLYHERTGEVTIVPHPEQGPWAQEAVTKLLGSKGSESGIARDFNRRGIPCAHAGVWTAVHVVKLYDIARDPDLWAKLTSRLTPERFQSAGQALAWLGEKESPSLIARRLNTGEYPHVFPGGWCASKVRQMVLNPALAGLRVHRGEIIGKGNWTGVITPREHYRLVAKLNDPSRQWNKDGERVKYLLSGGMLCDVCDQGCKGLSTVYRCPDGHASRNREKVDAYVVEAVLARLERPDAAELFRVQIDEGEEARKAQADAKELRARLDGFTDKAAEGELSPDRLARIEAKLVPKIEAAEARAKAIVVAPVLAEVVGPQARAAWTRLTIVQQREVLRTVVRPRLLPVGKGRKPFDPKSVALIWLTQQVTVPQLATAS